MNLTEYYFENNVVELQSVQDLQTKVKLHFVSQDKQQKTLTFDDIELAEFFNIPIDTVASRTDLMKQFKEQFITKQVQDGPFNDASWQLSMPVPEEWIRLALSLIEEMVTNKTITTLSIPYIRGLSSRLIYQKILIDNAVLALMRDDKHISKLLKQIHNNPNLLLDPKLDRIDEEDLEEDNVNL